MIAKHMFVKKKTLGLFLATAALVVVLAGCNDTLRQFIVPVPQPGGDPAALSDAIVLSTNPNPGALGSDLHIDVSGDSVVDGGILAEPPADDVFQVGENHGRQNEPLATLT